MPRRRNQGLDRILGRVENLDETNLSILVDRLVRDRALLERVFDIMRDAILVTNEESVIEYANDAAFQLLALRRREIGSSNLWRRIPELTEALQLDPDKQRTAGFSASCEVQISYPEARVLQAYVVPLEEGADHDLEGGSVLILSDVTEMKHSTEELIENERIASIMMLAAGVAHELGNPLNSLTIHLQLIKRQMEKGRDGANPDRILQSLEVCRGEVERLDGIITHFLQAIRPQPPDLRPTDLLQVLSEVLEVEEDLFSQRGVEVVIDVEAPPPSVPADPDQLKQVFFNVFQNSVDAMPEGGTIRIQWRRDPRHVYLILADNGAGIDPADVSRIFQPYFTTKEGGNGLGMMIVQRIMRDHHGSIALDSQPGEGTAVTLQFPVGQPEHPRLEERS